MKLSKQTQKSIEGTVGLPFDEILQMDSQQEKDYVEKKIGKKLSWREGLRVEGLPIRTMEEVDKKISKIIEKDER